MTAPAARRGFNEATIDALITKRDEPEWARQRRRDAWATYQSIPMPTRFDEEWRRTDLRDLHLDDVIPHIETSAPSVSLLPDAERDEPLGGFMALHDGARVEYRLSDALTAQGVIFTDLATAVREHEALLREYFMTQCVLPSDSKFAALHAAFWDNGAFLYVPKHVTLETPLRAIISASLDGSASLAHTLIVLDEGSQAVYAEDFTSPDAATSGFSSRVTEIILKQGANLHYALTQRWGSGVRDFHIERALLGRDTTVTMLGVELGAQLSKGRVEAVLRGDNANAKLLGLYVEDGDQHYDRYTLQDHIGTNGVSDLLFKGVLTQKARSVYSGLIRVEPGARKTAAYQQNRNLLLSRTARADSIPNLEIKENDILGCTHGATVGKVDEEQVYYMMCRGLTHADATRLIVEGFVEPLIELAPIAGLRDTIRAEIAARVNAQNII